MCQHEIGRKVILLPTHHAATLLIATRIHSMTFQRLLSIGRRIILLRVFQGILLYWKSGILDQEYIKDLFVLEK